MGIILGKISSETPAHTVLHTKPTYQIWRYAPSVSAVVYASALPPPHTNATGSAFTSAAFRTLARYIGVMAPPENVARPSEHAEPVAMTAPVVLSPPGGEGAAETEGETVAMTAPVVVSPPGDAGAAEPVAMAAPVVMAGGDARGQSMRFLLPSKYGSVEEAPVPTSSAVSLEMVPARVEAVYQFSGNLTLERATDLAGGFLHTLKEDGVSVVGDWTYQGYNPPFTLPWLKRNEIHVPVDAARFESAE